MAKLKIAEFMKTEGQPAFNISVEKVENGLVLTMNGPGAFKKSVVEADSGPEAAAAIKGFIADCME